MDSVQVALFFCLADDIEALEHAKIIPVTATSRLRENAVAMKNVGDVHQSLVDALVEPAEAHENRDSAEIFNGVIDEIAMLCNDRHVQIDWLGQQSNWAKQGASLVLKCTFDADRGLKSSNNDDSINMGLVPGGTATNFFDNLYRYYGTMWGLVATLDLFMTKERGQTRLVFGAGVNVHGNQFVVKGRCSPSKLHMYYYSDPSTI